MITEAMLALAAAEVSDSMVNAVQERDHAFSLAFERKLRTLTRRADHPIRYQVLRYAAAVLLVTVTLFGVLYAAVPQVRATVNEWVKTTFGSGFRYDSNDPDSSAVHYDYRLPDEIDGYILVDTIDIGTGKDYIYYNNDNQMLHFGYMHGKDSSTFVLTNADVCEKESFSFMGYTADVYISPYQNDASALIWQVPEENVLLYIRLCGSKEELIKIAEKIEKIEKNL